MAEIKAGPIGFQGEEGAPIPNSHKVFLWGKGARFPPLTTRPTSLIHVTCLPQQECLIPATDNKNLQLETLQV